MRHFTVHLATEIDFVDGNDVSDALVQNYEKHLAEELKKTAQNLSLRTIRGTKVSHVQVAETKNPVSL
jgi:hypothetical protein